MDRAVPGSLRGKHGRLSIWRIPNFLLEPRGNFLGERVPAVDLLNKIRSVLGTLMIVGLAIFYSGLSHLATTTVDKHGIVRHTVTETSPEGHWVVTVVLSVVLGAFLIPLVALVLVLCAHVGARRATLLQMRWPLAGIAGFFGLFALLGPMVGAANLLGRYAAKHGIPARVAAWLLGVAVAVLALVWLVKALYFAATGLFRADDGHPFLAVIVAPGVATTGALLMIGQADGLSGVPMMLAWITGLGGPLSVAGVSIATVLILRRAYPGRFPFRDGPVQGR